MSYWKNRAEAILLENEKSLLEYEKQLKRTFELALLKVNKEIESFYNRYSVENRIDLATARQRLNKLQLADFRTQLNLYLHEVDRLGLDLQYRQYLQELADKAYISKLQEVQTNIRHQIETLYSQVNTDVTSQLMSFYSDAFNKTLYGVQHHLGIGVSFTAIGDHQLKRAISSKWLDSNFSDRLWKNKTALITQLNTLIPVEFVRGNGPIQVSRDLSQKLNTSFNSTVRLVRTEMNHISNQGTIDSYRASKVVEKYEYLATLDNRTSEICRELDGKVFELSQAETGVNLPPMHPHCRSTTVPYFDNDDTRTIGNRIARDNVGNTYYVRKDMTYTEWKKTYASDKS